MIGNIYKITNSINGKSYIGQTIRSVNQRFKEHFHPSSGCIFLKRAMNKYAKECFYLEILESIEADSKLKLIEKLNSVEIEYINKHNTLHPNGYNGCLGGGNSADYRWSKSMSSESIARRAKKHQKPIRCNETGQEWSSIKECAEFFKVRNEAIHRVLRGVRDHFHGMSFSYVNPERSKPRKIREKKVRSLDSYDLSGFDEQRKKAQRPIKCNETGQTWDSIQGAADHFQVRNETIHRVLRGVRNHFRNLTFSYI